MSAKIKIYPVAVLLGVLIVVSPAGESKNQKQEEKTERNEKTEAHEQKPVTDPKKAWALGAGAMLIERNHWRHDYLGFYPVLTQMRIEELKQLFDRWWGINSREDLFDMFIRMDERGHRKRFEKMGAYVESLTEEQYEQLLEDSKDDKEKLQEIRVAKKYYRELGDKSILGWDYSRDIYLCRSGYAVGYISEEEAWQRIMAVAQILQKKFDSWEDLGRNYLIGRQFWSYKYTKEGHYKYQDAFQRLLDMPTSPWNKYPWDLDLTEPVKINEPNQITIAMLKNDNQIDKQQGR